MSVFVTIWYKRYKRSISIYIYKVAYNKKCDKKYNKKNDLCVHPTQEPYVPFKFFIVLTGKFTFKVNILRIYIFKKFLFNTKPIKLLK